MKRLSVIAVTLGLLCPAAAQAQDPALDTLVGGKRIADSLRIAHEFWRETPYCTQIRVYYTSPERLREAIGSPAGAATNKPKLDEPPKECPIWVSNSFAGNSYQARIDTCSMMVHELGHILHRDHDAIPNSIMNVTQRNWEVYACYKRFLPRGKGREYRWNNPNRVWAMRP